MIKLVLLKYKATWIWIIGIHYIHQLHPKVLNKPRAIALVATLAPKEISPPLPTSPRTTIAILIGLMDDSIIGDIDLRVLMTYNKTIRDINSRVH